jgi:hypothetical protein
MATYRMLRGTLAVVLILCLGAAPAFAQQTEY